MSTSLPWLALVSNQVERTRCVLAQGSSALTPAADERSDAIGIGWFQGEGLLLRRAPADPQRPADLAAAMSEVRSDRVLGALYGAGGRDRLLAEAPPLRVDRWLYAPGLEPARPASVDATLRAMVPAFLQRSLPSQLPSAWFLGGLLTSLWHQGDPSLRTIDARGAALALGNAVRDIDALWSTAGLAPPPLSFALLNDHWLFGVVRGGSLSWQRRVGVRDCPVCRRPAELAGREPRRVDHEYLRSVLLAPGDRSAAGWQVITAEQVPQLVMVTEQLELEVKPLQGPGSDAPQS